MKCYKCGRSGLTKQGLKSHLAAAKRNGFHLKANGKKFYPGKRRSGYTRRRY